MLLILSSDRASTSVILAGKRDNRRHFTTRFSENVVVTESSYLMLDGFIGLGPGER